MTDLFNKIIVDDRIIIHRIKEAISKKNNYLLTYINQHCYNIYCNNFDYKVLIDNKFTFFADGVGIRFALKFLGIKNVKNFNATDLNEIIINYLSEKGKKIFFIGGNFREDFIKTKFVEKNLVLAGYMAGYFNLMDDEIINKINNSNCEVIILGMGVPKQELLADILYQKLSNAIIICVGNFMEFFLGTNKRAPRFMRFLGIEWLFRLITEPKRLWKRYLLGIPEFIYRIIKMKLQLNNIHLKGK